MQARFMLFVACSLWLSLVQGSLYPQFPSPAFLWSGTSAFTEPHGQCLDTLSTDTVVEFVGGFFEAKGTNQNALMKFVRPGTVVPEILVVFLEPKPELSHTAYSYLKDTLQGATSSLVLPYTYKTDPEDAATGESIIGKSNGQAIVSGQEGGIPNKDLLTRLEERKELLSNGATELLMIYLESDTVKSELISKVTKFVQEQTNGNYIALFTADNTYEVEEEQKPKEARVFDEDISMAREIEERGDGGYYAQGRFWPNAIWEGLGITIVFGIILAIGVQCTIELQTPIRWEKVKLQNQ